MGKAYKHFRTITKHRHQVIKHCAKCGIFWQGLKHDLSKYSPTEFLSGAKYFQGDRSPNDKEREQTGYSKAWVHHMGRNPHHFEYWRDYSPINKEMKPIDMPYRYIIEMFCDRVAACKIYKGNAYTNNSALEYFENGLKKKATRKDLITDKTIAKLEFLLKMLADKGEKETFSYIKKSLKEDKYARKNKPDCS